MGFTDEARFHAMLWGCADNVTLLLINGSLMFCLPLKMCAALTCMRLRYASAGNACCALQHTSKLTHTLKHISTVVHTWFALRIQWCQRIGCLALQANMMFSHVVDLGLIVTMAPLRPVQPQ
jgi:hypothetical protein